MLRVQWIDGAEFFGPDYTIILSQHLGDPFTEHVDAHYYMKDCLRRFELFTGRSASHVPLLPENFFEFLREEGMLTIEYISKKI